MFRLVARSRACRLFAAASLWFLAALPASAQLTRDEAVQAVIDQVILPSSTAAKAVAFAPQTALPAGSTVRPFLLNTPPFVGSTTTLASDSWFVFIDDAPLARFAHPVRFALVDASHPNPVVGSGITVTQQGWWPLVNGVQLYASLDERLVSPDRVWGSLPLPSRAPQVFETRGTYVDPILPEPLAATTTGKVCAIVASGADDASFRGDVRDMADHYRRRLGVPAANVQEKVNITKADLDAMIAKANRDGCTKVHLFLASHGAPETVLMGGQRVSSADLAKCIKKLTAKDVCIVFDWCFCGSFIDNIQGCPGHSVTVTTATDASSLSCAWIAADGSDGNGYFTEDLIKCWADPRADGPDAGRDVSQGEAYDWVKANARPKTRDQKPLHRSLEDAEPIDPIDVEPVDAFDPTNH
jgi:Peptidase C13 family